MALELSTDPYVPSSGTLPAQATEAEAADWIARQRNRWTEGVGFSFAIADLATGLSVGTVGLWLRQLPEGRATAGYSVVRSAQGRGLACRGPDRRDQVRVERALREWSHRRGARSPG
jgi:RimJ/RimL family protein N-acetyltransferase